MKNPSIVADKLAISLSFLCTLHCLAMPLMLILLPSLAALHLDNEAFHLWMVAAVLPTSIYALTMGCKKHKRYYLLAIGAAGLSLLVLAVMLGESVLGERGEKIFTAVGSVLIATGHFLNYRLCRQSQNCDTHERCTDH
ncbi:MerC domain-containing protein [Agaribacterium haliotis]|uniref:MerC domain-containing protein n=1 Tax=Agaribacterium haliotis TaxID=2013869 RepID=UPI000BB536DC|nr:MerC domain-containing protein [Agaribacterium haliotis]